MLKYTCDPALEFSGRSASLLFECMDADDIEPLLREHKISMIEPDCWYALQDILDVMVLLSRTQTTSINLVAMGMKLIEYAGVPPYCAQMSFEEFMLSCDELYQAVHRNGDAGRINTERAGENHLVCRVTGPYPDDLVYGVVFGYARHLLPPDVYFTVYYDGATPRRDEGGIETLIHVEWG